MNEINIPDAINNYELLKKIVAYNSSGEVKIYMGQHDMKLMGNPVDLKKIKDELIRSNIKFNAEADFKGVKK